MEPAAILTAADCSALSQSFFKLANEALVKTPETAAA
jgi:hypothetical protein